jgi:hypothetical protein
MLASLGYKVNKKIHTMTETPPTRRGLLPSLSTTKTATPVIINCLQKEIRQKITIFKKRKNKERKNKIKNIKYSAQKVLP